MGDGAIGVDELSAIGERVGRNVHDAHNERALAELERTGTQLPIESRTHAAIVNSACATIRRNDQFLVAAN